MKKIILLLTIILVLLFLAWALPSSERGGVYTTSNETYITSDEEDEDIYVFLPSDSSSVIESDETSPIPAVETLSLVSPEKVGFSPYAKNGGLAIYKNSNSYLLIADLDQAGIRPLGLDTKDHFTDSGGIWEGYDTVFKSTAISQYLSSGGDEPFACAFNGQFFKMVDYPTHLAAPLKVDGDIITYGWETSYHVGEKLMMEIWPGRAVITPLDKTRFTTSDAPDIVSGLTASANKKPKNVVGRTFIGMNGQTTLFVLVSTSSTQKQAEKTLRSLGAETVMMLDGGGSSQLACRINGRYRSLIYSERAVPQAIYIFSH